MTWVCRNPTKLNVALRWRVPDAISGLLLKHEMLRFDCAHVHRKRLQFQSESCEPNPALSTEPP